jgi:hypothetical protein
MTTVIRAAGAADFLALVPHLVGFRPSRSLVLIPFEGNRTLGALRLDLPPSDQPDAERSATAATAIGMVCKVSHADAVAVIAYVDGPLAADAARPGEAIVAELLSRARMCGLRISDALCDGSDGWASYLDAGDVQPLAAIPGDHAALAEVPLAAGDQLSGAELPRADLAARERLARALGEIDRAMQALFARDGGRSSASGGRDDARVDPGALAAVCRMDDVPLLFEEALAADPAHLDPYDAGALVWCLDRPGLRDVALMQWSADLSRGDAAFEAQMRWSDGEDYPEDLAAPMWGDGPSPDPGRLGRALELVRWLAAITPRVSRPGVLAAAGWLAWATGRASHAAHYCQSAREIDPDHGLAGLVLRMADAGHLPEWVYRRSAPADPVTHLIDVRGAQS